MAISPIEVSKSLGGVDFPASKQDLVNHAKQKKAKDMILKALQEMPDREYENMADVQKGFGDVNE